MSNKKDISFNEFQRNKERMTAKILVIVMTVIGVIIGGISGSVLSLRAADAYINDHRKALWECGNSLVYGSEINHDKDLDATNMSLYDGVRQYVISPDNYTIEHNISVKTWINIASAVKFGDTDNCNKIISFYVG